MNKIVFYSNNCPRCKILKMKLTQKGLKHEEINDDRIFETKGFKSMPMLEVDGKIMEFTDAIAFVNKLGG